MMVLEAVIGSDLVLGFMVIVGIVALVCMAFATFFFEWGE